MPSFAAVVVASLAATALVAQAPYLVRDIRPGPAGANVSLAVAASLGGRMVFGADDGISGQEPWCTDGTPAGTVQLGDLWPGAGGSYPGEFVVFGNQVLFNAYTPYGHEPWVTDGTPAGTYLLADLAPGAMNSNPSDFLVFRGEVLFRTSAGVFRTDGTPAGTRPHPVLGSGTGQWVVVGARLYFLRETGTGHDLWYFDGATATLVTTFPQVASAPAPAMHLAFGDVLIFQVYAFGTGNQLWRSDGTAAGTHAITQWAAHPAPVVVGDRILYTDRPLGSSSNVLRATDGTLAGDRLVHSFPTLQGLVAVGDRVFFNADWSGFLPPRLWTSDGTTSGTQPVPVNVRATGYRAIGTRRIAFSAPTPANGTEPWVSDGTAAGTQPVVDLAPGAASSLGAYVQVAPFAGRMLAVLDDGVSGAELWSLELGGSAMVHGQGCAAGAWPKLRADDPVLGGTCTLEGRDAAPHAFALTCLGGMAATPFVAAPGCDVFVDVATSVFFVSQADQQGLWSLPPFAVPHAPVLAGLALEAQAFVLQPSPWLAAASNGVRLSLGH